jgi:hypothetical protein
MMADGSESRIENLQPSKETVQDLTEEQAAAAKGGAAGGCPAASANPDPCRWSGRLVCATRFLEHCQGIP